MAFQASPPPILHQSFPDHVFAAISSALLSNGLDGSPGTVQNRHASLPPAASTAINRQSPVPTKTFPSHTATPALTRAEYDPLMAIFSLISGSNFQITFPEAASTAYTIDCGALT